MIKPGTEMQVGAARADFFRYCVLFKLGGIYLDLKSVFRIPDVFTHIIHPEDEAILDIKHKEYEPYRMKWDLGTYEQWFLVYAPGHPYLKEMIDQMTRTINSRVLIRTGSIKHAILRLTGPDAYSAAIHEAMVQNGKRHREVNHNNWLRYSADTQSHFEYVFSNSTKYRDSAKFKPSDIYASRRKMR